MNNSGKARLNFYGLVMIFRGENVDVGTSQAVVFWGHDLIVILISFSFSLHSIHQSSKRTSLSSAMIELELDLTFIQ